MKCVTYIARVGGVMGADKGKQQIPSPQSGLGWVTSPPLDEGARGTGVRSLCRSWRRSLGLQP